MKIILSPSKTANWTKEDALTSTDLLYPDQTKRLLKKLQSLSKPKLKKALKLTDSLVQPTYDLYHQEDPNAPYHAFPSFHGLVFKQLQKEAYNKPEWEYITSHVRILDALYGVLEPGSLIQPYRLDMKAKLGLNLYEYWDVAPYFEGEQIINLASKEFSDMLPLNMIDIVFYQCKNGTCKPQATYSKMGRGMMLDYMIQNHVTSIKEIKAFNKDQYRYDETLSPDNQIAFSRTT